MPFHKVIHKTNIDNTLIADITNVSPRAFGNTANTAAEFLHFFAGDSNFIHADIAGTNEFKKHPVAAMLKTMFYFVKDFK
jgi:leucyl aminopeptidase